MSEVPPELDLKFLPDWLKEAPAPSRYADFEGETGDRAGARDRGPRRDNRRPGGGGLDRPRGPRPGGGPERRGPKGGGGPRDGGPGRGPARRDERPRPRPEERREPVAPPKVKLEFLPEPAAAEGIARQIKQSGRAYPLFGTARLFMEKAERYRVRVGSLDETQVLYQVGDGPVALDQASLEKAAFAENRAEFYEETVVQGEPIKGNFANVARSRSTGALLGPTSYHSYQPGLRRLYEERFSRRISFPDFLHQDIEIRTDEQTIADWKEQARSSTTFRTRKEETPLEFKTPAEMEQHFRTTYLRTLVKAGLMLECSGPASRQVPERALDRVICGAWEREKASLGQFVNYLRPYLTDVGLHFFKHRKRMLFVTANKPKRHQAGEPMSPGVARILELIEKNPKCTRRLLAAEILGAQPDAPEREEQKTALARDLHYLLQAGHVIEFHDGSFDLPMVPMAPAAGGKPAPAERETAADEPSAPLSSFAAAETSPVEVPMVVTPESELPSLEMPAGGPAPGSPATGEVGEFVPTFEQSAESAPAAEPVTTGYGGEQEALLPGASSLAEELPAEYVTPAEVVDLRPQPAPEPEP